VTESGAGEGRAWAPVLRGVAHASGHELRNALNALVVNLEVVRGRVSGDESVSSFMAQAVEQSEESVRLAEGAIALLNFVVDAMADGRAGRIQSIGAHAAKIEGSESEVHRLVASLRALAARTPVTAEASDTAVILSFPESSKKIQDQE
jgi:hypothetical protein